MKEQVYGKKIKKKKKKHFLYIYSKVCQKIVDKKKKKADKSLFFFHFATPSLSFPKKMYKQLQHSSKKKKKIYIYQF